MRNDDGTDQGSASSSDGDDELQRLGLLALRAQVRRCLTFAGNVAREDSGRAGCGLQVNVEYQCSPHGALSEQWYDSSCTLCVSRRTPVLHSDVSLPSSQLIAVVKMRLGVACGTGPADALCCFCGATPDDLGHHDLSCTRGGGTRHNADGDIIVRFARPARLGSHTTGRGPGRRSDTHHPARLGHQGH